MKDCHSLRRSREVMSAILADVCTANSAWAAIHDADDLLSCFDCSVPPSVPVSAYMRQVERAGGGQYWPMCLILIDTLSRTCLTPVTEVNVHRLVVTAYSLALKLSKDSTGLSAVVADVGGVDLQDLIEMECVFLGMVDWRVTVTPSAHERFWETRHLVQDTARRAATTGQRDGPITIIPGALVPVESRIGLELVPAPPASQRPITSPTAPTAPQEGSPRKPRPPRVRVSGNASPDAGLSRSHSTPGWFTALAPRPPTSSSSPCVRRPQTGRGREQGSTPEQGEGVIGARFAGKRFLSAQVYAREATA
eukprot:TRINITY_DN95_c0_g2_i1.p1 TRINITY_DN95_c0_g2~~TRINITY_DN95_c0_g2_i1.p1  ORF type:complete len:337 (+),score=56.79 TRINITY_DN95_c0_g2_i1:90-1013(+)